MRQQHSESTLLFFSCLTVTPLCHLCPLSVWPRTNTRTPYTTALPQHDTPSSPWKSPLPHRHIPYAAGETDCTWNRLEFWLFRWLFEWFILFIPIAPGETWKRYDRELESPHRWNTCLCTSTLGTSCFQSSDALMDWTIRRCTRLVCHRLLQVFAARAVMAWKVMSHCKQNKGRIPNLRVLD